MEKLSEDIMSKLLSHVPIEYVSRCKLVCRSWERILSHKTGGCLFSVSSDGQTNAKLYYADYYDLMSIDNPHRQELSYSFETHAAEIDHPPIDTTEESNTVAIGSCNGLVCFSVPINDLSDPVYICNPATGEYVYLPRFNRTSCSHIVGGFGYLSSRNEYKVVRICYPAKFPKRSESGWVQVYTLGNNNNNNNSGWRDVGEINNTLWLPGVQANGALHFMDDINWKIVAFDLETEEVGVLTPPPCFEKSKNDPFYHLQVVGGNLYVVHQQNGEHVDIWSFRHVENRDHYERREKDYGSWSWSIKFSFEWQWIGSTFDFYQPFAITDKNEVLLWVDDWNLCCYDQETGIFKRIMNMNEGSRLSICQGIPYKSSLVSLKDLGVRSKIRRQKTVVG